MNLPFNSSDLLSSYYQESGHRGTSHVFFLMTFFLRVASLEEKQEKVSKFLNKQSPNCLFFWPQTSQLDYMDGVHQGQFWPLPIVLGQMSRLAGFWGM